MITNRVDDAHRALVRSLPCCVCGHSAPSQFCHVRLREFEGVSVPVEEQGGMGLKPADRWSTPMCIVHHGSQHGLGERAFWLLADINPLELAQALWANRDNRDACLGIVQRARMGATL